MDADQIQQIFLRALSLHRMGQLGQAREIFEQVLRIQPRHFDAMNMAGIVAAQTGDFGKAAELFGCAMQINPQNAEVCNNRGNVLQQLKLYQDSLECYEKAIALKPDYAEAYGNRGVVQQEMGQLHAALNSLDTAIVLKPDFADAYNNRGNALRALKRYQAAKDDYDMAIALKPTFAKAYYNRGNALQELRQPKAALESFDQAFALIPDHEFLMGMRMHARMQLCDWNDFKGTCRQIEAKVGRGDKAATPLPFLAMSGSPELQRKVAEIWMRSKYPENHALPPLSRTGRHHKIRLAYFSADFHNHATSYLMAEMFDKHDKSRFELVGFSFGPNKNDEMRNRIAASFDQFIDVQSMSDLDVALLSRKMEVDIAIDLKGYTQDSRTGIFAARAAPIQVNYLGYPGTMGADYIDYLIADPTLIPADHTHFYAEKIAYLPNSYQPNDSRRTISDKPYTRADMGLPETGLIFCCFNNSYKITPAIFDVWMRILKQVEGSALWLLEDNPEVTRNLCKEAETRGIRQERLAFAKRLPPPEHLARHRLADLFLDTLPYNAHTTASDSLWAGLPVLTCAGETFAGRVAASLLQAIQLPELVTPTIESYESLAIELASSPSRLREIGNKLSRNRQLAPLFNTELYTSHIEAAYIAMYDRHQSGLPPGHIHIHA